MERQPHTFSRTRAVLRHLAPCAPSHLTRTRALLLDQQLTTCTTPPSPGMLRQIVVAIRHLAGPAWLEANADNPAVRAFANLDTTPLPPPLPLLDQILARCLEARFIPLPPAPPEFSQVRQASKESK
jgi:hypothetical protein